MSSLDHEDNFFITVCSDTNDIFPYNQPYKFQVDPGIERKLSNFDSWEVGVAQLRYPCAWNTIRGAPAFTFKHCSHVTNPSDGNTGPEAIATLPTGTYTTVEDLVDAMNASIPNCQAGSDAPFTSRWLKTTSLLHFHEVKGSGKCILSCTALESSRQEFSNQGFIVNFNDDFCDTFGFDSTVGTFEVCAKNRVIGEHSVRFGTNITEINVICNIVRPETKSSGEVARTLFSTLRVEKPKHNHILQVVDPKIISYKKIDTLNLRHLSFELVDQEGRHIDFAETLRGGADLETGDINQVYISLHFRRCTK